MNDLLNNLWVGIALVVLALVMVLAGRPNKDGIHPKFLQFDAAPVLYPPLVIAAFALGMATIVSALLTK